MHVTPRHSRRPLRLEPLETRDVPAASAAPVEGPTAERAHPVGPPLLAAPDMPALATLDLAIAAAVRRAWMVPAEARAAEWLIQLPAGQSVEDLGALGAVGSVAVPFWDNAYSVTFAEAKGIAEFPAELAGVAAAEFYYPVLPLDLHPLFIPNDTLFGGQWHLRNTGQTGGTAGADANLTAAWDVLNPNNQPVRGTGVTIGVVDDSLQRLHPDLAPNYSAADSFDFVGGDSDPSPGATDNHGTSVAGVAAARGNNNLGVSGAAPNATLAGLRFLGPNATDTTAGQALGYRQQAIDVYNNSWGPSGQGQLAGVGPQSLAAMASGVANGRGGLGNVYVNAGGNSRQAGDDINYDGFSNTRYAIAVGAIDHRGVVSYYSEPGAPMLVSAYSNSEAVGITTTDVTGGQGYNGLADQNYTNGFGGTSSAAPLVTGIVALMLDANPNLSWRDVKHVLVRTADRTDPGDSDWTTNGAGFHVNHNYGFGAIDAAAAVTLARTWTPVAAETGGTTGTLAVNQTIPEDGTGITAGYTVSLPLVVEHVEVVFNATHAYGEDLEIVLRSPAGTESVLARQHLIGDANYDGNQWTNWVLSSVRHWGESSVGTWTLTVRDRFTGDVGTFDNWTMRIYGTAPPAAQAPVLAGIEGGDLAYTAGQGQVAVTQTLAVSDADSPNLTGASVSIASGYVAGQDFLRFATQNGIVGVFNNGTMTLTGTATVAQYQAALRSVRYENTAGSPAQGTRAVAFQANDGGQLSNTATRNVAVSTPAGQAPVLAGIEGGDLAYTAGQGQVAVTQTLTVSDADSATLLSATVTIPFEYVAGQDFLRFTNQNGISGNFANGSLILAGPATVAQYQTALRSVRFENTAASPVVATRIVFFQVTDATGLPSNNLSRGIAVSGAAGQAPVLSGIEGGALSYTAGQGELAVTQALAVSDADSSTLSGATATVSANYTAGQDFLRFTTQNGISGSFAGGVLTLSGSASVAAYQAALRSVRYENTSGTPSTATRTIAFRATDGALSSNTQTRNIAVSAAAGAGTISFNFPFFFVDEAAGTATVTVERTGGTEGAAAVGYATTAGTAASGSDYTGGAGTLTWAAGEGGGKSITIPLVVDLVAEPAEYFGLSLFDFEGAAAGAAETTVRIAEHGAVLLASDNRPYRFLDRDGDLVTVRLGGNFGAVALYLTDGHGPVEHVEFLNTSVQRSALRIGVKRNRFTSADNGRVELHGVTGAGFKTLSGRAVNLTGRGIDTQDQFGTLTLADVSGGADIVARGTAVGLRSKLTLGAVGAGSDVRLTNVISRLTAASFGGGALTAPSVGTIRVAGNFTAAVDLDGTVVAPGKPVLGTLWVGGNVTDSTLRVNGSINLVRAAAFRDSTLAAGYDGAGFTAFSTVGTFKTTGAFDSFQNSHVYATRFKSISLRTLDADNDGVSFGFRGQTFGTVRVAFPFFRYFPSQPLPPALDDFSLRVI